MVLAVEVSGQDRCERLLVRNGKEVGSFGRILDPEVGGNGDDDSNKTFYNEDPPRSSPNVSAFVPPVEFMVSGIPPALQATRSIQFHKTSC